MVYHVDFALVDTVILHDIAPGVLAYSDYARGCHGKSLLALYHLARIGKQVGITLMREVVDSKHKRFWPYSVHEVIVVVSGMEYIKRTTPQLLARHRVVGPLI